MCHRIIDNILLHIIIPILLSVGLLSQMLLWLWDEIPSPTRPGQMSTQMSKESEDSVDDEDREEGDHPQVPGWTFVRKCEGSKRWLEYRYDGKGSIYIP